MKKIELSEIENYNKLKKDLFDLDNQIKQRFEYIAKFCCEKDNMNLRWFHNSYAKEIYFDDKYQFVIVGRNYKNNKGLVHECVLKFPNKWLFEDFETNMKNEDISFY